MSQRAFFQTFYGAEPLFRLAGDTFAPVENRYVPVISEPAPSALPAPVISPAEIISDGPSEIAPLPEPPVFAASDESLDLIDTPDNVAPEPLTVDSPVENRTPKNENPLASQNVLVLVNNAMPGDLLFLKKVLAAVNLDTDTIGLLTLDNVSPDDVRTAVLSGKVQHFMAFGATFAEAEIDIRIAPYEPVRFFGTMFLMADALADIEADRALKKRLWETLKQVFAWQ